MKLDTDKLSKYDLTDAIVGDTVIIANHMTVQSGILKKLQ